jgi:PAS domain S-box-containing protein
MMDSSNINVLLIDDEPYILEIAKDFLEFNEGIHADMMICAFNVLEMLELQHYDVIVSDYQMPDMDGIKLLKEIRGSGNNIPFILFTGRGREEIAIEALNAGADFYLQKGGEPKAQFAELRNMIVKLFQKYHTELELIENQEKFKDIFNSTNDLIHIIDVHGRIIEINDVGCSWLGYTKQEMLQKNVVEIDTKESAEKTPDRIKEVTEKGFALFETDWLTKDGQMIPIEINARKINYSGKTAILSVARNISERRRNNEILLENEIKFSMMADFTYDWEYWISPDGHIIYCSPSCEMISGHSSREITDDPSLLTKMVHPDDRTRFTNHFLVEGKTEPLEIDFRIITKKGEIRWISHICQAVSDKIGRDFGRRASNRDITERKRNEETLIKSDKRITSLNRMLKMLSQTNQMIVRSRDLKDIYSKMCGIAIDHGKFNYAWIGREDNGSITLIDSASRTENAPSPRIGEVREIEQFVLKTGMSRGLSCLPRPGNDLNSDSCSDGIIGSVLVLPIKSRGKPSAFLGVYSSEEDFFTEEERAVLEEMVLDVSFGWDFLSDQEDRRRAEESVKESEAKYRSLFENIPLPVAVYEYEYDDRGEVAHWTLQDTNAMGLKILGKRSVNEVVGRKETELYGPNNLFQRLPMIQELKRTNVPITSELYFDWQDRYYISTLFPLDADHFVSVVLDITDIKQGGE